MGKHQYENFKKKAPGLEISGRTLGDRKWTYGPVSANVAVSIRTISR